MSKKKLKKNLRKYKKAYIMACKMIAKATCDEDRCPVNQKGYECWEFRCHEYKSWMKFFFEGR